MSVTLFIFVCVCVFLSRLLLLKSWRKLILNILEQSVAATGEVLWCSYVFIGFRLWWYFSLYLLLFITSRCCIKWWYWYFADPPKIHLSDWEAGQTLVLITGCCCDLSFYNKFCCISLFPAKARPCCGWTFGIHRVCDRHTVQRRHQVHGEASCLLSVLLKEVRVWCTDLQWS